MQALDSEHVESSISQLHVLLTHLQKVPDPPGESSSELSVESPPPAIDQPQHDIRGIAEVLATDRFLLNDHDEIRLITANCLAELFRLSAPNPPVDSRKLSQCCVLFVEQLTVLAAPDDTMGDIRFSLLEQLSTIKTLVLFADDASVVCDVFACFYAISSPHHPERVATYLVDILVSLLEEMDKVEKDVLDAVLAPCIPAEKYSREAAIIAERVLASTTKVLQLPLCNLLNASVRALRHHEPAHPPAGRRGAAKRKSPVKRDVHGDAGDLSVHHPHLSDLIVTLHRVSPDVLIYVLPNLSDRVRSQDTAVRVGVVHLLSSLFTARSDLMESYPSLYTEYLNRSRDLDPKVRVLVVLSLGELALSQREDRKQIEDIFLERIHDLDESVRSAALRAVARAVDVVPTPVIAKLVERLCDKMESVRRTALDQCIDICSVPPKNLSSRLDSPALKSSPELGADSDSEQPALSSDYVAPSPSANGLNAAEFLERRMLRLYTLPNYVMEASVALRKNEQHLSAADIENVCFGRFFSLAKCNDDKHIRVAMRRLALFLSLMSEAAFMRFRALAAERARAREALLTISQLRLSGRLGSAGGGAGKGARSNADAIEINVSPQESGASQLRPNSRGNIEEARAVAAKLASYFPSHSRATRDVQGQCRSLATAIDLKIFDRIGTALHFDTPVADVQAAVGDAVSRLGSKTPVGIFCAERLFPRCETALFAAPFARVACQLAVEEAEKKVSLVRAEGSGDEAESLPRERAASRILFGLVRYFDVLGSFFSGALSHSQRALEEAISSPVVEGNWSAEVVLLGLKVACSLPVSERKHFDTAEFNSTLQKYMFSECETRVRYRARIAKWASRLLISLNEVECENIGSVDAAAQAATSRLNTQSGNLRTLIAPVAVLGQLAKYASSNFKRVALSSFDFTQILLRGSLNALVQEWLQKERTKQPTVGSMGCRDDFKAILGRGHREDLFLSVEDDVQWCVAEVTSRACKLLVRSVEVLGSEEVADVIDTLVNVIVRDRGDIFRNGKHCDSKDGQHERSRCGEVSGDVDASSAAHSTGKEFALHAVNRLSAGAAFLRLASRKLFHGKIRPDVMVSVMLLAQDAHAGVRLAFVRCIRSRVVLKGLPTRWCVCLALMAVDPETENVKIVQALLTQLLTQRRRIFEKFQAERKVLSLQLLPEATLPDLIWVLANLPDVELERAQDFPESQRCISLLVECLLASKEYAGMMSAFIDIVYLAEDATENGRGPKSELLLELSLVASRVLTRKLKRRKWDLTEYSGEVSLPRDLFRMVERRNDGVSGVQSAIALGVARKYDRENGAGGSGAVEEARGMPGMVAGASSGADDVRSECAVENGGRGQGGANSSNREAEVSSGGVREKSEGKGRSSLRERKKRSIGVSKEYAGGDGRGEGESSAAIVSEGIGEEVLEIDEEIAGASKAGTASEVRQSKRPRRGSVRNGAAGTLPAKGVKRTSEEVEAEEGGENVGDGDGRNAPQERGRTTRQHKKAKGAEQGATKETGVVRRSSRRRIKRG